ncbi:hypothetical protein AX15_004951 [Amanita polypyramis BW_CC]|nr:hypothetical protein AX15_004951 [Amanita polypyramis BW_CC]
MTEYDFSPEAYEKYVQTQHRIARWVDKTRRYTPSDPFVPTTPAARHALLHTHDRTDPRRYHSQSSRNQYNRRQSGETSTSATKNRPASYFAPAPRARWPTADYRSDPFHGQPPHPAPVVYPTYYPPAPHRAVRANTAPVYLYHYPVPDRHSHATHPNPMTTHTSARNPVPGRPSHLLAEYHTEESSGGKRAPLLKRLFSGIMGKSGGQRGERRRDSV